MLDEHQVGFLACLGCEPEMESLLESHARPRIILREGRVCDHAVELLDVIPFHEHRIVERILVLDLRVGNIVQDHVHLAN